MGELELLARLEALEARVALLEGRSLPGREPVRPVTQQRDAIFDPARIGKCVLIVAGAYVLRALTELQLLPQLAGVILGFAYALFWMRVASLYYAVTGALIATALLWEATARFHLLSVPVASGMLLVAALTLTRTDPLVANIMATVAAIGLAAATLDALAPMIAISVLGVVTKQKRLPLIIAADVLAVVLVVVTLIGRTPYPVSVVEVGLIAFAVMWFRSPQALIGLAGAAAVARFHGGDVVPVAIASLAFGAVLYRRREIIQGALAIAALLLVPPPQLGILFAVVAVAAASLQRPIDSAAWAWAAVLAAFGSIPSLLAVAALTAASAAIAKKRTYLIAAAAAAVLVLPGLTPLVRTAMFAGTAVIVSLLPDARVLARLILIAGGAKIIVQDLRVANATSIVIALAMYGAAILFVSRSPRANRG